MSHKKTLPSSPEYLEDGDNELGFVPSDEYRDPFAPRTPSTPRTPRKKGHHGT